MNTTPKPNEDGPGWALSDFSAASAKIDSLFGFNKTDKVEPGSCEAMILFHANNYIKDEFKRVREGKPEPDFGWRPVPEPEMAPCSLCGEPIPEPRELCDECREGMDEERARIHSSDAVAAKVIAAHSAPRVSVLFRGLEGATGDAAFYNVGTFQSAFIAALIPDKPSPYALPGSDDSHVLFADGDVLAYFNRSSQMWHVRRPDSKLRYPFVSFTATK